VQGKLADVVGLRTVTLAAAALMAAVMLIVRAVRPGITEPLDEAVTLAAD